MKAPPPTLLDTENPAAHPSHVQGGGAWEPKCKAPMPLTQTPTGGATGTATGTPHLAPPGGHTHGSSSGKAATSDCLRAGSSSGDGFGGDLVTDTLSSGQFGGEGGGGGALPSFKHGGGVGAGEGGSHLHDTLSSGEGEVLEAGRLQQVCMCGGEGGRGGKIGRAHV